MQSSIIKEDVEKIREEFHHALMELRGKTVLITGSNGLIGSYITDTLVAFNKRVDEKIKLVLVNRNRVVEGSRLSHLVGDPDVEFFAQDLGADEITERRVDFILHAASRASPKSFMDNPLDTIDTNVVGTRNLLEKAVKDKSKGFVFFSSGENYGNPVQPFIPTPESYSGNIDPLDPRSCYTESKRLAEQLCVQFHKKYDVPVRIPRILLSYGPGMKNDGKVISDFFSAAFNERVIKIRDRGEATRSFMYVADTARAIFSIMFFGKNGEAYNVSDDRNNPSIREIADLIAQTVSNGTIVEANLKAERKAIYGVDTRLLDIKKLRALGHESKTTLEEGLYRLKLHFEETGELYEK